VADEEEHALARSQTRTVKRVMGVVRMLDLVFGFLLRFGDPCSSPAIEWCQRAASITSA
jgi:hypothetical protein